MLTEIFISFSCTGSISCLLLSLADIPWLQHHAHLGISSTVHDSYSRVSHNDLPRFPCKNSPTHSQSQELFLNLEEVSAAPVFLHFFITQKPGPYVTTAKFGLRKIKTKLLPSLNYVCICVDLLRILIFTNYRISWVVSCPQGGTPFVLFLLTSSCISLDYNLKFPGAPSSSNDAFCYFFFPFMLFFTVGQHRSNY